MVKRSRRDVLKAGIGLLAVPMTGIQLASAQNSGPYADAVLVPGELPLPEPGSFTIAVLPDTQNYSEHRPDLFIAQTEWIAAQKETRNIQFVLHLGDITNHNLKPEWENAQRAMSILDGHVPFCMVPGNHDYGVKGGTENRATLLNEYFPVSRYRELPTFGGTYDQEPDRLENSYHLLTVGDRKLLIIGLEFGPRKDVVRWANEVAAKHRDREAILITHAYMYDDDTRYDWKKYGKSQIWNPHNYPVAAATNDDVLDGEELWQHLVSKHENFIMTLNGHVLHDGLGRLTSQTAGGRDIHQMLVNFQMKPNSGDGWLRLLEFSKDGKTTKVCDYSPVLKQRNESSQNKFDLKLSKPS